MVDRQYSVGGFERVEVSTAVEFEITRSEDYTVRATGPEDLTDHLEVDTSGGTLIVHLRPKVRLWPEGHRNGRVKVFITMPGLRGLVVSGASRGSVRGFASDDDFDLDLAGASEVGVEIKARNVAVESAGASRVKGELKMERARLEFAGASRCELAGDAHDVDLELSGASRADLSRFETNNANAELTGASRLSINVSGTLNADLSGASRLEYTGSGVPGQVETSGASSVVKK